MYRRPLVFEEEKRRNEDRYCGAILYILLFFGTLIGLLTVGFVLNNRIQGQNDQIKGLKITTMHLESDIMSLMMMQNLAFETRFIQNGTAVLGFPKDPSAAIQSTSELSDFVTLTYSLQEIILTPTGVPLTVLKLSGTPRPIVFNGYTPPASLPKDNNLYVQLALFSPGINSLDSLAQNFDILPYSSVTASKILLEPNCVLSAECLPESAFNPFFTSSVPTFNSVDIFPNNNGLSGTAVLQFLWGQPTYSSIPAQYDFTGTTVSFNGTIEMMLPVL